MGTAKPGWVQPTASSFQPYGTAETPSTNQLRHPHVSSHAECTDVMVIAHASFLVIFKRIIDVLQLKHL
jgi:hypothetical protein